MTRVLIAENQTLIRKLLGKLLEADSGFTVVAEAENGKEVISNLQRAEIDLLILNMVIPGISGVHLITRAKASRPGVEILIISMHSDIQLVVQAFKNGAGGYISTMHTPDEFMYAVRKVTKGERYIDPALAESMVLHSVTDEESPVHSRLSQRELEIYRQLVSGKNVNQIAEQLAICNKTVSSHKKNLMQKMHFSTMADLMRYAVQGNLFDDQPPWGSNSSNAAG